MLGSLLIPSHSQPVGLRRNTYSNGIAPPLPPRRNSLSTAPAAQTAKLQLRLSTLPKDAAMSSRYGRATSPRRYANPARSSTGTFVDPYYDSSHYGRPSSPRSSGERITGSHHAPSSTSTYYTPSSSGSRASAASSYTTGRARRNTGEAMVRPSSTSSTSMPLRTPYTPHSNLDRPSSPLTQTYISHGAPQTQHKKIYRVDDNSHSAKLVAEKDVVNRDSADRGYSVTSGGRSYHPSSTSKPPARLTDLGDDGYSYTDPASMYRDTEPAWRRPRAGSLERGARPTSMIVDRPARNSVRELGPPPSTRGFDKINNVPRSHGRSSSIDRSREIPKYDPYPDAALGRTSSTRQRAPAIHQEPRDHRRESYHEYDRRDEETENRRHSALDRGYEDRDVTSRGFGIAPGIAPVVHDRQPIYPPEPLPARPDNYDAPYHSSHRAEARMPEPRLTDSRISEPRGSREWDGAHAYDSYEKRPREREREGSAGFVPVVAGAATGVAAAAALMKSRDRDRDSDRTSSEERERERRREHDERDRRDKHDDRRDRRPDDRDEKRERRPEERREAPPVAPAHSPLPEPERKHRDRRYDEDERDKPAALAYAPPEAERKPRERRYEDDNREKSSRKAPSPEGSGDDRTRHYVDRDAERRKDSAPKEATLDPDEEYRRRIQQEAERVKSAKSDREPAEPDRERERQRRRDDRDRSGVPDERFRASPPTSREPSNPSYDVRSSNSSVYDGALVQEPETIDKLNADQPSSKSVTIVTPPKEPPAPVKGILRKPTEKFPDHPESIREGVAPHKDALKGKDIPVDARWTRIDRRLVNPQALEEAQERFEERMDCVIVLRVLTKQDIQKLADRTKRIRERRGTSCMTMDGSHANA
jgi:hypothetical protein